MFAMLYDTIFWLVFDFVDVLYYSYLVENHKDKHRVNNWSILLEKKFGYTDNLFPIVLTMCFGDIILRGDKTNG